MKEVQMQKLELTHAREGELYSYQIALLTMVKNCNLELTRIKEKLAKVKKEREDNE
jgi:hypothetical protein